MSKWKCEICGAEFENFHAQGFDNKIYCPLCYFKRKNQELKKRLEVGKEQYNDLVEEKEELEQENQELKELNIAISKGLKKVTAKRNKWRNRYYKVRRENGDQQKEFIEWLEKEIQRQEDYAVSLGLTIDYDIAEYTSGKIDALKESLSKYEDVGVISNERKRYSKRKCESFL